MNLPQASLVIVYGDFIYRSIKIELRVAENSIVVNVAVSGMTGPVYWEDLQMKNILFNLDKKVDLNMGTFDKKNAEKLHNYTTALLAEF